MTEEQKQKYMNDPELQQMMMGVFMERQQMVKEETATRYSYLNQFVKKGQVLFAGSSLMEQFPIAEFQGSYDIDKIIYNRGIGGYVMSEFDAHLEECVFQVEPARLFTNIGTNDLSADGFVMADFIASYEAVLKKIMDRMPDLEIYLMAYYPVNINCVDNSYMKHAIENRSNERIHEANAEVAKLAERLGIRYIDVNKNLYDANGELNADFCIDGMHMYGNGYHAIMDDLIPYVKEVSWK